MIVFAQDRIRELGAAEEEKSDAVEVENATLRRMAIGRHFFHFFRP